MSALSFATTATNGASAKFSCAAAGAYRYNPGARLYAFSSRTSGGYTASVTDDGVSTLTATTFASQNGTLANCATYDALYGSAGVNYSTGLPGTLTMHHLFGMLNLHLTNSGFSADHPVTVTINSSTPNIIPGNGGSATLTADGTLKNVIGSWGTNWYTTITPTTSGVVDVYLMTWPFSAVNGALSVSCSDASTNSYIARSITLSGFSLAAAQLKSKPVAISSAPAITSDTYSKLYAWDATDSKPVTVNTAPTNANTTNPNPDLDSMGHALYACKSCPSLSEISWYLYWNCYWDNGNVTGGNTTSYTCADGSKTKAGMWFLKKSALKGFSSTVFSEIKTCDSYLLTADVASASSFKTDYFFLPAVGYTYSNGSFNGAGTYGYYWSSTPDSGNTGGCFLYFDSSSAGFSGDSRAFGCCLWTVQ